MNPEEIFIKTPEEIRTLAGKVLQIEKEYLLDRRRHGIFDRLLMVFQQEGGG